MLDVDVPVETFVTTIVPVADGLQLIEEVRIFDRPLHVSVVVESLSSASITDDVGSLIERSNFDFIPRPSSGIGGAVGEGAGPFEQFEDVEDVDDELDQEE